MRVPNGLAVPFTTATVLALGASFMTWSGSQGYEAFFVRDGAERLFFNAWNSHLYGGRSLLVPNWTPSLLALTLTVWAWGGAPRSRLAGVAVAYGLAHTLLAGVVAYQSANQGGGVIGAGIPLTFVAFAILAAAMLSHAQTRRKAEAPQ